MKIRFPDSGLFIGILLFIALVHLWGLYLALFVW